MDRSRQLVTVEDLRDMVRQLDGDQYTVDGGSAFSRAPSSRGIPGSATGRENGGSAFGRSDRGDGFSQFGRGYGEAVGVSSPGQGGTRRGNGLERAASSVGIDPTKATMPRQPRSPAQRAAFRTGRTSDFKNTFESSKVGGASYTNFHPLNSSTGWVPSMCAPRVPYVDEVMNRSESAPELTKRSALPGAGRHLVSSPTAATTYAGLPRTGMMHNESRAEYNFLRPGIYVLGAKEG
eukprot:TRINITY_DN68104_c0_g1_i1.p1 TRINITY_DN68104_c0_g1~~TRINITY_DN68104_c0_g1_i1.p1  ORF type:complete len:236 (-),score=32.99 TRINITY_DN68104_c0_g1_i1:131-838(-)